MQNVLHQLWTLLVFAAPLLNGSKLAHDGICHPAFAFDAADAGRGAACIDLRYGFLTGKDLVQVAHRAYVGIAGVGAPNTRRISDHGLDLLSHDRLGVRKQDGVSVALGHLASVGARELWGWRQKYLRLRQNLCACILRFIKLVEPARHLAREFDVCHLVLAYGNVIRLIYQNVCRLQQRIAEEPIGRKVFAAYVFLLLLIGRDAFQPAEWRNHGEEQMQLGMLFYVALHKDDALLGVKSGGKKIERHIQRVLLHLRWISVIGREGVPVGDEEVATVFVLEAHPVPERSHVVAQMQLSGWTHAAEHALIQSR